MPVIRMAVEFPVSNGENDRAGADHDDVMSTTLHLTPCIAVRRR